MHACGHDTHMAILLATAADPDAESAIGSPAPSRSSSSRRKKARRATERPAGAELMVKEGVLANPKVEAIFGLHVFANVPAGHLTYRSGSFMAGVDTFEIIVKGRQTHGSTPWRGVDPVVVGVANRHRAPDDRQPQRRHHARCRRWSPSASSRPACASTSFPTRARLVGTIRTFDERSRPISTRASSASPRASPRELEPPSR